MKSEYLDCYFRVSTTQQKDKGHSLNSQELVGKKVSKKLGLKYRPRNEGSKSSMKHLGNREVLEQIKFDIEKNKVKNLWIIERERLFRDTTDSMLFRKHFLEKYNVKFFVGESGDEVKFNSSEDTMMYDVISRVSQYENEKRIERSQRGKRFLLENVEKGELKKSVYLGGTSTFGYDNINKEWVINKNESKWVKWIFKSIVDGKSVMDIKNHLDKNGVRTRRTKTGLWNLVTIQKMLRNESYTGIKKWFIKKENREYTYTIPHIISKSIFLKVQKIMDMRNTHQDNNKKHFFLLDEILFCDCGFRMGSRHRKGKTSKGYNFDTKMYYCVSRERKWRGDKVEVECSNTKSLDVDKTNSEVIKLVKEVYSNSKLLKERFKKDVLSKKVQNEKELNDRIKTLDEKDRRLQKQIENTLNNISDMEVEVIQGRKDKRIVEKIITSLKKELDLTEKDYKQNKVDIETLLNEKEWVDWVSKFSKDISVKVNNKTNQREFLKGLINDIQVSSVYGKNRENNKVQIGHSLNFNFKMKIVNDRLVYNDEKDKKKGYEIVLGKNTLKTNQLDITLEKGKKKRQKIVNCNQQTNNLIHSSKLLNSNRVFWKSEFGNSHQNLYLYFSVSKQFNNLLHNFSHYNQEQEEVHSLIKSLQEKGMGYRKISQYLNEHKVQTKRNTKWTNTKVFSVLKRHRERTERLRSQNKDYEMIWNGKMKVVFI